MVIPRSTEGVTSFFFCQKKSLKHSQHPSWLRIFFHITVGCVILFNWKRLFPTFEEVKKPYIFLPPRLFLPVTNFNTKRHMKNSSHEDGKVTRFGHFWVIILWSYLDDPLITIGWKWGIPNPAQYRILIIIRKKCSGFE